MRVRILIERLEIRLADIRSGSSGRAPSTSAYAVSRSMVGDAPRSSACRLHDCPHHVGEQLVDRDDRVAEAVFEQSLVAQVVPETVHVCFVAQRGGDLDAESCDQLLRRDGGLTIGS